MRFNEVFHEILHTWSWIAGVVFALVVVVLGWAVVFNRAGRRRRPLFRVSQNVRLELGYAAVLAAVAAVLVIVGFGANARVHDGEGNTAEAVPAERIDVTAYRWCWDFRYTSAPIQVTGECRSGEMPTVVVPAGRPVEFALTSHDVIHSFWLPDFAVKRDANPGQVNELRMTFPEEGRWKGRCSEYCGTHHVTMDFWVEVVSPEEYQDYLASGGIAV